MQLNDDPLHPRYSLLGGGGGGGGVDRGGKRSVDGQADSLQGL